jgi:hypothetical protein
MTPHYEALAHTYAPQLYYAKTANPFQDIAPDDMGGVYWRLAKNSKKETDFCVQYIVFFYFQRWVPSVLDKFSGKLPGEHPNDYVPIFMYFKDNRPVKAVFDICHYEAVGEVTSSSECFPSKEGPVLSIRNFYRGIVPLKDTSGYIRLEKDPVQLDTKQLNEWWKGRTSSGVYNDKARLIIKKKLKNPFQTIKTFRDQSGRLGILFDAIFRISIKEPGITISTAPEQLKTQGSRFYFSGELQTIQEVDSKDVVQVAQFVEENILEGNTIPPYVQVRDREKGIPF